MQKKFISLYHFIHFNHDSLLLQIFLVGLLLAAYRHFFLSFDVNQPIRLSRSLLNIFSTVQLQYLICCFSSVGLTVRDPFPACSRSTFTVLLCCVLVLVGTSTSTSTSTAKTTRGSWLAADGSAIQSLDRMYANRFPLSVRPVHHFVLCTVPYPFTSTVPNQSSKRRGTASSSLISIPIANVL